VEAPLVEPRVQVAQVGPPVQASRGEATSFSRSSS